MRSVALPIAFRLTEPDPSANASAARRPLSDKAIAHTASREVAARMTCLASRRRALAAAVRRSRSDAVTCVTPTDEAPRTGRRWIRCRATRGLAIQRARLLGRRAE